MLSHHPIVLTAKFGEILTIGFSPRTHQVTPWIHWAWPTARRRATQTPNPLSILLFKRTLISRVSSMQHFELFELGLRCRKLPLQRGPLGVDAGAQIGKLGGHLHLRDAVTDSDA